MLQFGYPDWFYDKIFGEEKTYNAYVASLLCDEGVESGIVGYIMLELNKREAYSYIQALFVEKEYRDKNIGKRLIDEAESYSKSIGFKDITAQVRNHLIGFYNKLGFSICQKLTDSKYSVIKNLERNKGKKHDYEYDR